jgi:hypothetical protein
VRRHEFEHAKLLAGLVLIAAAVLYAVVAQGDWQPPLWWMLPVGVGAGMGLAGLVAALTWGTGRARRRRGLDRTPRGRPATAGPAGPPGPLPGMPMDELRGEYDRRFGEGEGESDGKGGAR